MLDSEFGEQTTALSQQIVGLMRPNQCQILMFVGTEQNQQRSNIVAGLGMFMCAHHHRPTLIVDADPESRRLSRGFEQRGAGILEAIGGKTPWQNSLVETSCVGLQMIPCGMMLDALDLSRGTQPAQLAAIKAELQQAYGLVLIDAGNASSSLSTMLANYADGTFICVQLGKSSRELLVDTTDFLVQAGAEVKGCITTNPE